MEILHESPLESSFVPLSVHQSQTPSSFYPGPRVLYFRAKGRLLVLKEDASRCSSVESLVKDSQSSEESWLTEDVEVWVSSEYDPHHLFIHLLTSPRKFLLWRSSTSTGVSIPYPSISLHALGSIDIPGDPQGKAQALYLEVTVTKGDGDAEDDSIALNFVPQLAQADSTTTDSSGDASQPSVCQRLYNAVTECADLHPDPVSQPSSDNGEDEDEDTERPAFDYEVIEGDDMPPPFPGSSGWITSANMHQFFDEDGNWRAGGLGTGAGLVRSRDEDEQQVNGHHEDGDEDESTKWRRTD